MSGAALLERDGELAALTGTLDAVRRRGRGRVALVSGEAGAGKTQLLRRHREDAERHARVLWAACDPLFTPRPLGPLLDVGVAAGFPHDVAASLLHELSGPAPTVLVLEDAHWADEATLDVVRLVARRIESVPALLLLSYRDEQVDRTHPLRMLLGELPRGVERVVLGPLSAEAVASLAEPAGVDARALHERTGGNPFFVTEALAAGTEEIPATVRDAVLARAARLGEAARAVLDAVAVVPQQAELWLLEALEATGGLEEGLRSGMLRADRGGVGFRHELARLAVEESLPPDRRVALHRRALAALADPPAGAPDLARLAHHAEAAGDAAAVLRFAPAAAEQAASVGAHREADAQYARALRFADGLPAAERADLLERFAAECYLTELRDDAVDAAREAVEIHRERGDAVGQARALRLTAKLVACAGHNEEARAALTEAVALAADHPGPELARVYAALAGMAMVGDEYEQTLEWSARAIAVAEDVQTEILALTYTGTVELTRGVRAGLEMLDRALELSRRDGLTADAGRAYINVVAGLGRRRDWRTADGYLEPGLDYCREHGLEAWHDALLAMKGESDLAQGRWDAAADAATTVIARASDHILPLYTGKYVLALVRARRGDPGAWELLDEVRDLAAATGDLQYVGFAAVARAEAQWLAGRPEAVDAETAGALALAVDRGEPWLVGEIALWRRRAGLEDALPALDDAGPFALPPRDAAGAWRALGCVHDAALALADAGDEAALREAHEALRGLGAAPAASIVARRLRALGARDVKRGPRAPTRENAAGLTRRELDVLPLLAEGLRNADIARRLVVSQKTVDHHVSAILRKLRVRTRGEAAAQAVRLGLLED